MLTYALIAWGSVGLGFLLGTIWFVLHTNAD